MDNRIMKILLPLFILLLSFNLLAVDKVTVHDPTNVDEAVSVVNGSVSYTIYTEESTGTDASPFKSYLAFYNGTSSPIDNTLSPASFVKGNGSTGPIYLSTTAGGNTQSVTFPLELDTDGQRNLYVAVYDGSSSWKVFSSVTDVTTDPSVDLSYRFAVDLNSICSPASGATGVCNTATTTGTADLKLFFFLDDTTLATGTTINPASTDVNSNYSGNGVFWTVKVSSKVPSLNSAPVISAVRSGDKRINIDYSVSSAISDFKEMVAVYTTTSNSYNGQGTFSALTTAVPDRVVKFDSYKNETSGEIILKGLTNGNTYYGYVTPVDKFYLAPVFSNKGTGTSKRIEQILKEKACFILSAGFGEEHPIIESFRFFRDHYLKKTFIGQVFVNIYYKVGPPLALLLYQSEFLRATVRVWATSFYYLVVHLSLLMFVLGSLFLIKNRFLKKRSLI